MHYWNDSGSAPWGMWVAMAVMMTTFVVVAAWVVVTLVRNPTRQPPTMPAPTTTGPSSVDAAAILDERFARGEIDAGEYTQRKALLRSS